MGFNSAFKGLIDWFCITVVEIVYSAVQTASLYKTIRLVFKR